MTGRLPVLGSRRFGCTRCGNCCVEPGYVYFDREEMKGMARYLGIGVAEFKRRYQVSWDPDGETWQIQAIEGQGCPLLTPERGCSVHPAKPKQCKTFPFWDDMVQDLRRWDAAKSFCPGLDAPNGRVYSREDMDAIRQGLKGT